MAQAEYVSNAIRALITGASTRPSTCPVLAAHAEFVAALAGQPRRSIPVDVDALDLEDRADDLNTVFNGLSAYLTAVLVETVQNVRSGLDLRNFEAVLSDLASDLTGAIQHADDDIGREAGMTLLFKPADRRFFIGGSDARIIMGDDEEALLRVWREKRAEVEPEDRTIGRRRT